MMTFIEAFKKELAQEAIQTRRMLEIIPADKMDWRPHPKSMDIRTLATHQRSFASQMGLCRWRLATSKI